MEYLDRALQGIDEHGVQHLVDPTDALPSQLRPRPRMGLVCPICSRKFASNDGYIRHAISKHLPKECP
jgi:hypothetical protein